MIRDVKFCRLPCLAAPLFALSMLAAAGCSDEPTAATNGTIAAAEQVFSQDELTAMGVIRQDSQGVPSIAQDQDRGTRGNRYRQDKNLRRQAEALIGRRRRLLGEPPSRRHAIQAATARWDLRSCGAAHPLSLSDTLHSDCRSSRSRLFRPSPSPYLEEVLRHDRAWCPVSTTPPTF